MRQASKNIKKAIDEGYLVEVQSGEETGNTEDGTQSAGNGFGGGSENAAGDAGQTETADGAIDQEGDGSRDEPLAGENTEMEIGEHPEDGSGLKEDTESGNRIDVEALIEEASREGEQYLVISTEEDSSITAEQYLTGKLTAFSEDGTVWLEGGLPLKNTGFHTGGFWLALSVGLTLFISSLVLGSICMVRNKVTEKRDRVGFDDE